MPMISVFLFGLAIGSFLNCLIWRLYQKDTILGRSYCPACHHQLAWYDNIPLFSFIYLGGKCRHCRKHISWQYPLVELFTGLMFAIAYYMRIGADLPTSALQLLYVGRDWFLISVMIVIFIYDLRWYLILDVVSLPSALIILCLNLLINYFEKGQYPLWQNLFLSGIIGGSFFLFQFIVSKGRWVGGGDIRLGLLMGLALGWPQILAALFIAYIVGSIVGILLIVWGKKQWGSEVPFGIFLTSATLITLFWGTRIIDWYISFF